MSALVATLTHDGIAYDAQVATIEGTMLGAEDHGVWTAVLHFTSSGWGQSNPARGLDRYDAETKSRVGTAFGMDHIIRIVETLGCRDWEHVKGLRCLVLRRKAFGQIEGIADLDGERVLIFQEHADRWFPAVQS